jgi:hypothetical protein
LTIGGNAFKVDVRLQPRQRLNVRMKTHGLTGATSSRRLSHFIDGRRLVAY